MIRDLYNWVIITFWEGVISEIKSKNWTPCKPTVFKHVKLLIEFILLETKHESILVTIKIEKPQSKYSIKKVS